MSTQHISALPAGPPQRPHSQNVGVVSLKRKLSVFLRPDPKYCYPSPPMSNPPSPPRHPPDNSFPSTTGHQAPISAAISISTHMPGLAIDPPLAQHGMICSHVGPSSGYAPFGSSSFQSGYALQGQSSFITVPQPPALASLAFPGENVASASGDNLRAGRKSKAHVASACVNCKRAHLSCDINRPCARCVTTGKQDTCYDVQHKKRGRPRLREEGELKGEQLVPQTSVVATMVPAPLSRPIASTRPGRADSFRSIQTHTSESSLGGSSISPTYSSFAGAAIRQGSFAFQAPPSSDGGGFYAPSIAFLNLDLMIVKANRSLQQSLSGREEVTGRYIYEFVDVFEPGSGQSFDNLRKVLHEERERHDPTHMPPIKQPGSDPIEAIQEEHIGRYTTGFQRDCRWVSKQSPLARSPFTVRIQLAKADVYFAILRIERFQIHQEQPSGPPSHQPHFMRAPVHQAPNTPYELGASARQTSRASVPHVGSSPYQVPGAVYLPVPQPRPMGQPPTSGSAPRLVPPQFSHRNLFQNQSFPSPSQQPYAGYAPPLPSLFAPSPLPKIPPRHSISESTSDISSRSFQPIIRDRPLSSAGIIQLPPLITTGPSRRSSVIGSTSESSVPVTPTESIPAFSLLRYAGAGEEKHESPRKRRRMGIDDVLRRD